MIVALVNQYNILFKLEHPILARPERHWPPLYRISLSDFQALANGAPILPDAWITDWLTALRANVSPQKKLKLPYQSTNDSFCPEGTTLVPGLRCLPTPNIPRFSPLIPTLENPLISPLLSPIEPLLNPLQPLINPLLSSIEPLLGPLAPLIAPIIQPFLAPPLAPPLAPEASGISPEAPIAPEAPGVSPIANVLVRESAKTCMDEISKMPWSKWSTEEKQRFHECVMEGFRRVQNENEAPTRKFIETRLAQYDERVKKSIDRVTMRKRSYQDALNTLNGLAGINGLAGVSNEGKRLDQLKVVQDRYALASAQTKIAELEIADAEEQFRLSITQVPSCSFPSTSRTANPKTQQLFPGSFIVNTCSSSDASASSNTRHTTDLDVTQRPLAFTAAEFAITRCCGLEELALHPPVPFPEQMPGEDAFLNCDTRYASILFRPIIDSNTNKVIFADMECDPCEKAGGTDSKGIPLYRRVGNQCLRRDFADRIKRFIQSGDKGDGTWNVSDSGMKLRVEDIYALPSIERALQEAIQTWSKRAPFFLKAIERSPDPRIRSKLASFTKGLSTPLKCRDTTFVMDPIKGICVAIEGGLIKSINPSQVNPSQVIKPVGVINKPVVQQEVKTPNYYDQYLTWESRTRPETKQQPFDKLTPLPNAQAALIEQVGLDKRRSAAEQRLRRGQELAHRSGYDDSLQPPPPPPMNGGRNALIKRNVIKRNFLKRAGGNDEMSVCSSAPNNNNERSMLCRTDFPYVVLLRRNPVLSENVSKIPSICGFVSYTGQTIKWVPQPLPIPSTGLPPTSFVATLDRLVPSANVSIEEARTLWDKLVKVPNCLPPLCRPGFVFDPIKRQCLALRFKDSRQRAAAGGTVVFSRSNGVFSRAGGGDWKQFNQEIQRLGSLSTISSNSMPNSPSSNPTIRFGPRITQPSPPIPVQPSALRMPRLPPPVLQRYFVRYAPPTIFNTR